jgi:hypothetical protein
MAISDAGSGVLPQEVKLNINTAVNRGADKFVHLQIEFIKPFTFLLMTALG